MNKYALILPLALLSFFLGYFSSCLQDDQLLVVVTVAAATATVVGLVLVYRRDSEKS